MNHERSRPRAFTLLELLAATALAAVLMVVLLQVVAAMARARVVLERDAADGTAPWQADLVENLRWDLTNTVEGTAEPGRLRLTGHGSLVGATLEPGHRPVNVSYAIEQLGGRPWLVRRQSPRGGLTNERGWSELVCPDVSSFAVEPVEAQDPVWAKIGVRGPRGPATLDASTRAVRLRVDGTAGVIVDQVVVLR